MTTTSAAPRLSLRQLFRAPANPDVEPQMRTAAERVGAAYRKVSAHEFAFEIATRPGRTQVVYADVDAMRRSVRVKSRVGRYTPSVAPRTLLTRNAENIIGSVCVEDVCEPAGPRPFIFVKADSDFGTENLERTLAMTAWTADEMERDLFGHDVE